MCKVLHIEQILAISNPPIITAPGRIISLVLSGSHAYGTSTPDSDEDWRGVYVMPNADFLGLDTPTLTYEQKPDIVLWEIAQFGRLLLKGNPNIVGMLWTPDDCVSINHYPMSAFIEIRESLITRKMVYAYIGWAKSELSKALSPKQLSHVPRLMWEIQDAITEHNIPIRMNSDRRELIMAIKNNQVPTDTAISFARDLLDHVITLADSDLRTFPDPPREKIREIILDSRNIVGLT